MYNWASLKYARGFSSWKPYMCTGAALGHTPYQAGGQRGRGTAPEIFIGRFNGVFKSQIYEPHDLPHLVGKLALRPVKKTRQTVVSVVRG